MLSYHFRLKSRLISVVPLYLAFGCAHLNATASKPDLSLIPKIGPHPEMTQLEIISVSPDFNPPISAKDALKIANLLTQGQISTQQPEKIKVEPVAESKTSSRKVWSISYFGKGIRKPLPPWSPPPIQDNKGNILSVPIQPTPKPIRTVLSIGIDPDTGKNLGKIWIPETSWVSWMPPTKEGYP